MAENKLIPLALPDVPIATLIIVQGLDGDLYGGGRQPSAFVQQLVSTFHHYNIFGYEYPRLLRQFVASDSPPIAPIIMDLKNKINFLTGSIFIIGHCLGGLIVARAVLQARPKDHTQVTTILIDCLADAPADAPNPWAVGLLEALNISLPELGAQGRAWRSFTAHPPKWFSAFAILSAQDGWIHQFHPANGISKGAVHQFDVPHNALVQINAPDETTVLEQIRIWLTQSPGPR